MKANIVKHSNAEEKVGLSVKMGTSTYDRVRKHREQKKSTSKGIDELRAKNRVYAARSRAKKETKRLSEEKTILKSSLTCSEQRDVDNKVQAYCANLRKKNKDRLVSPLGGKPSTENSLHFSTLRDVDSGLQTFLDSLQKENRDCAMTEDEERVVNLKILRYEVKILNKIAKNDLMEIAGVLLNLRSDHTLI